MRLHIELDDATVREIDAVAGHRGRTGFIRAAIYSVLDQRRRSEVIRAARGSIESRGHEWDGDPIGWVREQRRTDQGRIG